MPPEDRIVPRFAAEPPQDQYPYGAWAETLQGEFLGACLALDAEDLGEPGDITWYPDRTWHGRTYVPGTCRTSTGLELFGFVSFRPGTEDEEPGGFAARADYTEDVAENNPDWKLDLCDEVIGRWRGEHGHEAAMTLVWGRVLLPGGALVTAELAELAVDQCDVLDDRFTLIAPDAYRSDYLEIRLWNRRGGELATESLYAEEDEEDGEEETGEEG